MISNYNLRLDFLNSQATCFLTKWKILNSSLQSLNHLIQHGHNEGQMSPFRKLLMLSVMTGDKPIGIIEKQNDITILY